MKHNQFLIRIHRIIPQLGFMVLLTYFYGWIALLLAMLMLCMEIPLPKFDRLNPFYRRFWDDMNDDEVLRKQVDDWLHGSNAVQLGGELRIDGQLEKKCDEFDHYCPNCRREYEDNDYVYQMCHHCGHDNIKL